MPGAAPEDVRRMKVPGLRSDHEKVGGVVFFGRMLDKIRLKAAGRLPAAYFTRTADRTHFDARCCRFLHIDYDKLVARTLAGGSDEEILQWCFAEGRRPTDDDIEVWNEFMSKRGWRDSGTAELEQTKRAEGFGDRADILTWFDLHAAEEE